MHSLEKYSLSDHPLSGSVLGSGDMRANLNWSLCLQGESSCEKKASPWKINLFKQAQIYGIFVVSNIFFDLPNFILTSRSVKFLDFHYFSFFPDEKEAHVSISIY